MMKKIRSGAFTGRFFSWLFMSSVLLVLWAFLTPSENPGRDSAVSDEERLWKTAAAIRAFVEEFHVAPLKLREVAVYGEGSHDVSLYDAYGERLGYQVLSPDDWLLRAFGPDRSGNHTLNPADAFAASFQTEGPPVGFQYRWPGGPHFFPAPLLSGACSPDGTKCARIYQHDDLGQSLLLVQGYGDLPRVQLGFHDRVEEFLWLPDSSGLVLTGVGSERYRDGIYLWDLRTDATRLLWGASEALGRFADQSGDARWFLSLAGISPEGQLYAFASAKQEGQLLPDKFFVGDQLLVFDLGDRDKGHHPSKLAAPLPPDLLNPVLMGRRMLSALSCPDELSAEEGKLAAVAGWCQLSLTGEAGQVLMDWQGYSERVAGSVVFPYSLWILSLIYHDTRKLWAALDVKQQSLYSSDKKTQQILSAYGAEIAQALRQQLLAPQWTKAMAAYFQGMFFAREGLSFRMTDLVLQPQREGSDLPERDR